MTLDTFLARCAADCTGHMSLEAAARAVAEHYDRVGSDLGVVSVEDLVSHWADEAGYRLDATGRSLLVERVRADAVVS